MMRVMALDLGDVRIGVGLSDETATLASGLVTLKAVGPRKDAQALAALARARTTWARSWWACPCVWTVRSVPRPRRSWPSSSACGACCAFPWSTRDERLTSVAADERLAEAGVKRRFRKARIDQAAAVPILQEHLDERKAATLAAGGGEPA